MTSRKALVLGGSGLIGKACLTSLAAHGFDVTGVSRSRPAGSPHAWVQADIGRLSNSEWADLVEGVDVVVNAAGALQDGANDSLKAIHVTAIARLVDSLKGKDVRIVQISAAGVDLGADTLFFRSKAQGDAVLMAGHSDWVILRPALVIGPEAYGGTALLRAHAGFPLVEWRMFEGTQVQIVSLEDVAQAVVLAATGKVASGTIADLAEPEKHDFSALSTAVRRWQGFGRARLPVQVPSWMLRGVGACANGLGWLGWRSPLRSTALRVMRQGIAADGSAWTKLTGQNIGGLEHTLASMPAHTQERWFARMFLMLPVFIAMLSMFWLLSGIIGLCHLNEAMSVLTSRGAEGQSAQAAVIVGGVADISLGLAILFRSWTRLAAAGMLVVSVGYLIGGAILAPDLWADPMGPMVKVLPSMVLALIPLMFLEDR